MITTFSKQVAQTIAKHNLLSPNDKIIVALSGGADSVALLVSLLELGYHCIAAHCNFHLRGEESQRDMQHCKELCDKLDVELITIDFDVERHRKDTGESIEMACRSLRYEWFDNLLNIHKADVIAVGHHREDNIETMLLNLFRGTGIEGLRGIRYRRDNIIRPLLDRSRTDIENYLAELNIDYITDSSNLSDDYQRNKLRLYVIPEIERNFPGAIDAMLSTMSILDAEATIIDDNVDNPKSALSTLLYRKIKPYGFNPSQASDMLASADHSGISFKSSKQFRAELDRGILNIFKDEQNCDKPYKFSITIHNRDEFSPTNDPSTIYLDAAILKKNHEWTLRPWQKGDRLKPFGLKGSKLVSDIFSDMHFSAAQKRNTKLLCCDDEIIWIIGIRSSRLFTITASTKQYIKIQYNES